MSTNMSISRRAFVAAVAAAIRAPSLHNSQPWRFRRYHDESRGHDEIHVLADPSRTPPIADADGWATRIACGAATYNLQLALAVGGQPTLVQWQPVASEPTLLAVLQPGEPHPPTPHQRRLFRAIPRRHSNRRPFLPQPVPQEARLAMVAAAREEGAWLDLVVGAIPAAAVSEIAHAASRVLHRNQAYAAELASWRRRERSRADPPDGKAAASGPDGDPAAEAYDLLPLRAVSDLVSGPNLTDDPLIAVLGTAGDSHRDHLRAGFALQRVLLTITDHGLSSSLLSQPIAVPSAREQLRIALGRYGTPQMVLRVGYAGPASPTPRRPVADVIESCGDRIEASIDEIEASRDGIEASRGEIKAPGDRPTDPATGVLRP
jgi:nitroreductase